MPVRILSIIVRLPLKCKLFYFPAMDVMVAKFDRLRVSKGHLLTVKDDAQKIRDAFFHGKPTCFEIFEMADLFCHLLSYSDFAKFLVISCTVERCKVGPRNSKL